MDRDEAERLVHAIRLTRMDWIKIQAIERNPITKTYKVNCLYRELRETHESWAVLSLTSPRQWIQRFVKRLTPFH